MCWKLSTWCLVAAHVERTHLYKYLLQTFNARAPLQRASFA